jgi:fatty acid-binding protein DegV
MESLYALLDRKENLPTTAPFTVVECFQTWQELTENAEAILHTFMTQAFTAAYTAALQAQGLAREKLPETRIEVIDSRTVEGGLGLLLWKQQKWQDRGKV